MIHYIFDPEVIDECAMAGLGHPKPEMFDVIAREIEKRYPGHIGHDQPWIYSIAGGAMIQMKLYFASLFEYVMIWGTPIGSEGHSGRHRVAFWDTVIDGEAWYFAEGQFEKRVYMPGDRIFVGKGQACGMNFTDGVWAVEYARGPLMLSLPFGLADETAQHPRLHGGSADDLHLHLPHRSALGRPLQSRLPASRSLQEARGSPDESHRPGGHEGARPSSAGRDQCPRRREPASARPLRSFRSERLYIALVLRPARAMVSLLGNRRCVNQAADLVRSPGHDARLPAERLERLRDDRRTLHQRRGQPAGPDGPSRWNVGVLTIPGQQASTSTALPAKLVPQALRENADVGLRRRIMRDMAGALETGHGRNEDDAAPLPCSDNLRPNSQVSSAGARQFISSRRQCVAREWPRKGPMGEEAALQIRSADVEVGGTVRDRMRRNGHRPDPARAAGPARRNAAQSRPRMRFSRSGRRAASTRFRPRAASCRANSAPRPSEPPTMTHQGP